MYGRFCNFLLFLTTTDRTEISQSIPLCSLECGSLLPPLFVWSCSGSGKAQASLRRKQAFALQKGRAKNVAKILARLRRTLGSVVQSHQVSPWAAPRSPC